MRNKNSIGQSVILEVAQTADVSFDSGDFTAPDKAFEGFKVRSNAPGNLLVHYVGDPADRKVVLAVNVTDEWLSDRIDIIYDDALTTITDTNLLIGW